MVLKAWCVFKSRCDNRINEISCWLPVIFSLIYVPPLYKVLYKSRCDNRLNEITERASSDKREVCSSMLEAMCTYSHLSLVAHWLIEHYINLGRVPGQEIWREIQTIWWCSFQVDYWRSHLSWFTGTCHQVSLFDEH